MKTLKISMTTLLNTEKIDEVNDITVNSVRK
jgi:hypothetical protein